MALLLDTRDIPRQDRAEAVEAAVRFSGIPAVLTHEDPTGDVHARVETWDLGGGATFMRRVSSGITLTRTPEQLRASAPERLALSVLSPGRWSYTQLNHSQTEHARHNHLVLTDHAAPYQYVRLGPGITHAFNVDHSHVGLAVDVLHRATANLARSPLYPLLSRHLLQLSRDADTITTPAIATMLGRATIELVRALLCTAAGDDAARKGALVDTLQARIIAYVQQNLSNPDLGPELIAAEHHMSVRNLHRTWMVNDVTLTEWVMNERLEAARRELIASRHRERTISSVAQHWGFVDSTHFSRRFRAKYGMSPRECRLALGNDKPHAP
jgi:AraC-like DNA-binding protein